MLLPLFSHYDSLYPISGLTIGPADPALQGGAVSGGRKIARKCGTFFGKLNCSTSKSTRFRLEMHIFIRFLPPFSLFCWDLILKETFNKSASWGDRGRQMGDGGASRGAPIPNVTPLQSQVFLRRVTWSKSQKIVLCLYLGPF